ncbi:MAG: FHA domain-containing protein [Candidatus Aminicenantes bacterium]|nr:FHA domain-containing protein [Candidatus Aminicenantes bacterium]
MVLFRKKKESSEAERIIQLTIINGNNETGDNPGKVFNMQCGNNFIGRDPLCEVILHSGTVSRKHANLKVSYNKSNFTLYDLGSANGVIIKPSTVLKNDKVSLQSGDELQVGEILLKLLAIDQDEAMQTMSVDVQELLKQAQKQKKE